MANQSVDYFSAESLFSARNVPPDVPAVLAFGLGAGLGFEYLRRPHETPTFRILCHNRHVQASLDARMAAYQSGSKGAAVKAALNENALLFNLDRQPTAALMGMEMLAEQLPDYDRIPGWQACLDGMAHEIEAHRSGYRRIYLEFLQMVQVWVDTRMLVAELAEIVTEWDQFAFQLRRTIETPSQLELVSRLLRRLAFREEHFWGQILEVTG